MKGKTFAEHLLRQDVRNKVEKIHVLSRRIRDTGEFFDDLGQFIGEGEFPEASAFFLCSVPLDWPLFAMDIEVTAFMNASRGEFNEDIINPLRYSIENY